MISHLASRIRTDYDLPFIHFYDFEYDQNGIIEYSRDYFIVPNGALLGIGAVFAAPASPRVQLIASEVVSSFSRNLESNSGVYNPDKKQMIATKNQAWVAIILYTAKNFHASPSSLKRMAFAIIGPKPDNWLWSVVIPLAVTIALAALAWYVDSTPRPEWTPSWVPDGVGKGLSFVFAALFGLTGSYFAPRVVKRLFPGY